MIEASPINVGLALLIINGGVQWIRELRRGSSKSGNGEALKLINDNIGECKTKMDCIDRKIGEDSIKIAEIRTNVKSQKSECKRTVKRFDETISKQNSEIIALAKNSGKRK